MEKNKLKEMVQKAENIIEYVDEAVINSLVKSQHGSEDFKENQRISNAVLKAKHAINALKYEL